MKIHKRLIDIESPAEVVKQIVRCSPFPPCPQRHQVAPRAIDTDDGNGCVVCADLHVDRVGRRGRGYVVAPVPGPNPLVLFFLLTLPRVRLYSHHPELSVYCCHSFGMQSLAGPPLPCTLFVLLFFSVMLEKQRIFREAFDVLAIWISVCSKVSLAVRELNRLRVRENPPNIQSIRSSQVERGTFPCPRSWPALLPLKLSKPS